MENQITPSTDIPKERWEERYQENVQLPWDISQPAPELEEYFATVEKSARPEHVLEVGCGTGANAIWLAKQGCKVVATEIAPTALKKAKAKAGADKIEFFLTDICESSPVKNETQDFVFDRGVYHVIAQNERANFIEKIASALKAGGHWLSIAGNKDELRKNPEIGPPQLTAVELISAIEPHFEIVELGRTHFILPDGSKHLAWKALYRKRTH